MRRRVWALLSVYALGVLALTLLPVVPGPKSGDWREMVVLIPFDVDAFSFVLNVLMFVPFGVLVPLLWRRADAVKPLLWYAAATSSGIELTQLVMDLTHAGRRTVDVNDVIANVAGALLGLWLLRRKVRDPARRAALGARRSRQASGSR